VALTLHAICRYAKYIAMYLHSNYLNLHAESQQFSSLAEKNKQSALKWRGFTDEGRGKYLTEAAAQNCGDALLNSKKEAHKIISHLVDNVCK